MDGPGKNLAASTGRSDRAPPTGTDARAHSSTPRSSPRERSGASRPPHPLGGGRGGGLPPSPACASWRPGSRPQRRPGGSRGSVASASARAHGLCDRRRVHNRLLTTLAVERASEAHRTDQKSRRSASPCSAFPSSPLASAARGLPRPRTSTSRKPASRAPPAARSPARLLVLRRAPSISSRPSVLTSRSRCRFQRRSTSTSASRRCSLSAEERRRTIHTCSDRDSHTHGQACARAAVRHRIPYECTTPLRKHCSGFETLSGINHRAAARRAQTGRVYRLMTKISCKMGRTTLTDAEDIRPAIGGRGAQQQQPRAGDRRGARRRGVGKEAYGRITGSSPLYDRRVLLRREAEPRARTSAAMSSDRRPEHRSSSCSPSPIYHTIAEMHFETRIHGFRRRWSTAAERTTLAPHSHHPRLGQPAILVRCGPRTGIGPSALRHAAEQKVLTSTRKVEASMTRHA